MTPLIAIAPRLKDLNVNSGEHASPQAILCGGQLQVAILRDAAGTA
jgi:hypothetical protein